MDFITGSADDFTEYLKERGYDAFAPFSGTVYNFFEDKLEVITEGIPIKPKEFAHEKTRKVHTDLVDTVEELLNLAKALDGRSNKELISLTQELRKIINKTR